LPMTQLQQYQPTVVVAVDLPPQPMDADPHEAPTTKAIAKSEPSASKTRYGFADAPYPHSGRP
jgi:hypothetical protein